MDSLAPAADRRTGEIRPFGRSPVRRAFSVFSASHVNRIAAAVVVILTLVGALADFLASDLPLYLRFEGKSYVLPMFSRPPALEGLDNSALLDLMVEGEDWALFPPVPYHPNQSKVRGEIEALAPPSVKHVMGTDDRGRDVFARVIHGTRISLSIGFVAVGIYLIIGVFLGAIAGYRGGFVDSAVTRLIEVMMSFPTFFFILAIQGLLERTSIFQLMVVIGLTRWTDVARLVRGEILRIKNEKYVVAARSAGLSRPRLLVRHILPNALGPVLVSASFGVAGSVLIEAALSFLGFGTPPPTPSWGELLTQAYLHYECWWLTVFPGLALFLTVLSYNLVGEGLRDAVDPKLLYD
jgi:peptide/nickel transport system permease protein